MVPYPDKLTRYFWCSWCLGLHRKVCVFWLASYPAGVCCPLVKWPKVTYVKTAFVCVNYVSYLWRAKVEVAWHNKAAKPLVEEGGVGGWANLINFFKGLWILMASLAAINCDDSGRPGKVQMASHKKAQQGRTRCLPWWHVGGVLLTSRSHLQLVILQLTVAVSSFTATICNISNPPTSQNMSIPSCVDLFLLNRSVVLLTKLR